MQESIKQVQQRVDSGFLAWVDAHRFFAGSLLLATFAIGLYGYYPFIVDDWPRLDHWQKAAIWTADVMAVVLVLEWMLAAGKDGLKVESGSSNGSRDARRRLRRIALSLLISLLVDIGVTSYGVYLERLASAQRAGDCHG